MKIASRFVPAVRLFLVALPLVAIPACTAPYPAPPETRVDPVADVIHGVEFVDDYRWLEDQDAAETRAWIAAQNAYAELVVGESPIRDRFRTLLRESMDRENVGSTRRVGDYEYFTMRRVGEEAPIVYRRPAPEEDDAEEPTVDGDYEVFIDPALPRPRLLVIGASPVAAALCVKRGAVPDHLVEQSVAENATFLERLERHRKAFG